MAYGLLTEQIGSVRSDQLPPDTATQLGGAGPGNGSAKESGNSNMQTPAGGLSPASTGGDIVVAVYAIPAAAFDQANRCATITANGNTAANTNSKTIKIIAGATAAVVGSAVSGGTTIATTGAITTSGSTWALGCDIIKTGAKGSNTQTAIHQASQVGATVTALSACQSLTMAENATILVAVTINCATTASDASLWNFQVQWFN